jgi:nucleoid-associated protein YgaU
MQSLTVCGGTLFDIACRILGDAAQWQVLAEANAIDDPWLTGVVTLVIPASANGAALVGQ